MAICHILRNHYASSTLTYHFHHLLHVTIPDSRIPKNLHPQKRQIETPKRLETTRGEDGRKLGINVDHLDGRSGLLVRRVDPEGLVHQHNLQVWGSKRWVDRLGWVGMKGRKGMYVYYVGLREYKYLCINMKEHRYFYSIYLQLCM